jgi:hypothetical protein
MPDNDEANTGTAENASAVPVFADQLPHGRPPAAAAPAMGTFYATHRPTLQLNWIFEQRPPATFSSGAMNENAAGTRLSRPWTMRVIYADFIPILMCMSQRAFWTANTEC